MKNLFLLAVLLFGLQPTVAQTRYGLLAGGGASFLTGKTGGDSYRGSYGLAGQVLLRKAISRKVVFESGIGYQQRRFGLGHSFTVDSTTEVQSDSKRRYHYLTIPVQVSYALRLRPASEWWIGGGTSYGFLLQARQDITFHNYYRGRLISTDNYADLTLPQGLFQTADKPIAVYSFHVAAQLHATWYWRQHYLLRVFYDYGLYDANAEPRNGSRMHLNLAGLSLGYLF